MAGSGRPKKWIAGQQLAWFRWRIKSSNLEAVVVAQRCCASRSRSTLDLPGAASQARRLAACPHPYSSLLVHSACQNVRPARGGAPLTARESASGSRRKALGISNKVPLRRHRHELRPTHVKLPPVLHSTIIASSLVPALIFPSLPFPLSIRIRRQKLIHIFCCSPSFSVYKARTYHVKRCASLVSSPASTNNFLAVTPQRVHPDSYLSHSQPVN
jgi:hypothetical protein